MPRKGKAGKKVVVVKKLLPSLLDLWVIPKGPEGESLKIGYYGPFSTVWYEGTLIRGVHNGRRVQIAGFDANRFQWYMGTRGGLPIHADTIEITSERPKS